MVDKMSVLNPLSHGRFAKNWKIIQHETNNLSLKMLTEVPRLRTDWGVEKIVFFP